LKAARGRLGWSREALAFHSGVSWSAIAQIESGRRRDLRLTSLSALAGALGVSTDYLIGIPAAGGAPNHFEHRVLCYGSDDEFLAAALPFLAAGLQQSQCVVAIATEPKVRLVQEALGESAGQIEFSGWDESYRSPAEALGLYRDLVNQRFAEGATWVRVLGEAAWAGESDAEIAAWTRYESLVNLAFASSPVTFMCTYDERLFSPERIEDARRTHPLLVDAGGVAASPAYREPADFLLEPS
jgi:transcriptional regulator with XRE-family HTH domain